MAGTGVVGFPIPAYPLVDANGYVNRTWREFFYALWVASGVAPSPTRVPTAVTLGASPMTFTANGGGSFVVVGGAIQNVSFIRNPVTIRINEPYGMLHLSQGDALQFSYKGAPVIYFIPD